MASPGFPKPANLYLDDFIPLFLPLPSQQFFIFSALKKNPMQVQ